MFANFDCVLNGEDFWGSVKNGITEDTATHWIRHIVRLDNTQVSVASSIPKTFEGKCAYDELMYARKALEKND